MNIHETKRQTTDSYSNPDQPANIPAERAVLGALLLKPELIADLRTAGLRAGDFSLSAHAEIFDKMVAMLASDIPVDLVTVADALRDRVPAIGGVGYLADLTTGAVPLRKHVLHQAAVVRVKARLRRLQVVGEHLQDAAGQRGADLHQLVRSAIAELSEVVA